MPHQRARRRAFAAVLAVARVALAAALLAVRGPGVQAGKPRVTRPSPALAESTFRPRDRTRPGEPRSALAGLHPPGRTATMSTAVALLVVLLAVPPPAAAVPAIDPNAIEGGDGGPSDQLAAATLTELEAFWETTFPSISTGEGFQPPAAYFSVDPGQRAGPAIPCLGSPAAIEGNAFYCPAADVLGYDRAGLLPTLREQFGDTAAVVVLAHEFGHAVQHRLDPRSIAAAPTIVSEAQADCYAGLFLRHVRDGRAAELRASADDVDGAMTALVTFRDPVGTAAADANAHGNAFDRASSFQAGFDGAAATCAQTGPDTREFTQSAFTSQRDQASRGNLALPELVDAMTPDLDRFFGDLVRSRGAAWAPPATGPGPTGCAGENTPSPQGPVVFCPAASGQPATIRTDERALDQQHRAIGDYATGTMLAARYGLAAVAALGRPVDDGRAGRPALCLAGAYTGAVGDTGDGFGLSPGDLDEAVAALLRSPQAAGDVAGATDAGTGYERVRIFRGGVTAGPDACLEAA